MKVSVLGAGGWGTTLAILLHYNGHSVNLWEYQKSYAKELIKKRINQLYLPGVPIPKELNITYDIEDATTDKNLIVLSTPSQFLRGVVKKIHYPAIKNTIVVSVSKGIEKGTLMTMAEMLVGVHPKLTKEQMCKFIKNM